MFHPFSHCFILLTFPSHKINAQRYGLVWSSIAQDYLLIMASSVSSERAFSQGRITISKHRNHLKGDIVEALQCVKCAIHHDLLFCEPGPLSLVEDELDEFKIKEESGEKSKVKDEGWDGIFLEDTHCDDSESDTDIDLL
jgi:hypothetical protein